MDWIPVTCTAWRAEIIWATDPGLASWMAGARLNATCGIGNYRDDQQMKSALNRLFTNVEPAISNLETLQAEVPAGTR
jgi:hypothetical protein